RGCRGGRCASGRSRRGGRGGRACWRGGCCSLLGLLGFLAGRVGDGRQAGDERGQVREGDRGTVRVGPEVDTGRGLVGQGGRVGDHGGGDQQAVPVDVGVCVGGAAVGVGLVLLGLGGGAHCRCSFLVARAAAGLLRAFPSWMCN